MLKFFSKIFSLESETKIPKTRSRIKWQWKSNPDPWSKTEESQWTSYSPEHNYLIEKAYFDKAKEVDLGEYTVSPGDLIQKKKGNVTLQRPIRRINCEDDEMDDRSERYFETELPKTINNIFGDLGHFISFFSRRNPQILELTKQLEEFERINDLDGLNKTVRPQLIGCLEDELLQPIENQFREGQISLFQKKLILKRKKRHEDLISLFQKECASFEEFYERVLKSYTMSTDLYLNLNKYLRNESWTMIDNLLPYVICLCKAFFRLKGGNHLQKRNKLCGAESSLILYRGTALDELALSSYQAEKPHQAFSWNSLTSTSTNQKIAEEFMYLSADIENKKFPVLFIIEIPFANDLEESEYLKWIDIHQYSAKPKEDEVILPPGSVFELEQISTDQDKRTTIKIKLKHDVGSLAHEGLIMQGILHTEMMGYNQVKIMCLKGEELSETLKNLIGNQLLEEIDFCLCTIDNKLLEELLHLLSTLKKTKKLKFACCKYEDEQGISNLRLQNVKYCNILEVEIFEFYDFYKIFSIMKDGYEFWASLRKLNLDLRNVEVKDFVLQGCGNFNQLELLRLYFHDNEEVTDEGVCNLGSQGLNYFTQATSLTLDFSSENKRKKKDSLIFPRLEYLGHSNSLILYFKNSYLITEKGVNDLISRKLRYCLRITSLTLDFSFSGKITSEIMGSMTNRGLRYLYQLTSLTIDFSYNREITNQGMEMLSQGLQGLTKLKFLTLDFSRCSITSLGVNKLTSQGLKFLTQLTSLVLNFSDCGRDLVQSSSHFGKKPMNLDSLAFQGLEYLTQLISLAVNFQNFVEVTDKGLENLGCQGLRHFTKLTSLVLNFSNCKITDEGMNILASQGLKYLSKLDSLTLHFYDCSSITGEGVNSLVSQGLKNLTQLTSLTLSFSEKTEKFFNYLIIQGLNSLTKLTSLILNDNIQHINGDQQTKESQELNSLTKLTSHNTKHINDYQQAKESLEESTPHFLLMKCIRRQIPSKLKSFFYNLGVRPIPSFNSQPSPNILKCSAHYEDSLRKILFEIVNQTSNPIKTPFKVSPQVFQLNSFTLNFHEYPQITDEGVSRLSQGLKYLIQLSSLTLDFSGSFTLFMH